MDNRATRRIKGGGGTGTGQARGRDISAGRWRSRFFQFFLVSALVHAAALAFVWHLSSPEKPRKVVELINISVAPFPGPAGGGGKSEEIKEPPKEPPRKEEVPEKEPVKTETRLAEKPKEKPKKDPEKVEAPKPQQEMPAGPGQGPVGGGGKKADEALTGPITVEGGINFPELARYLKRFQGQVDRRWRSANTISFLGRKSQPKAVLYFTIEKNGKISNLKVDTSSGVVAYDNSAVGVIRDIQKNGFERLPSAFNGDSLAIRYTFMMENK